jgi:ribonuclease HII
VGVGAASVEEIDRLNILQATYLAMRRAVAALPIAPVAALIDGNGDPDLPCPSECIIDGDAIAPVISAASIIAKVERDAMMAAFCEHYPGYGFARHKGYGVPEHQEALARLGPCPIHRRSFKSVRAVVEAQGAPLLL